MDVLCIFSLAFSLFALFIVEMLMIGKYTTVYLMFI